MATQNNQISSHNIDVNIPFEYENEYVGWEQLHDLNLIPTEEGGATGGTKHKFCYFITKFSTCIQTIQRIWRRSNYGQGSSETIYSRKSISCGRKRVQLDKERFRHIPLKNGTTVASLACALDMKKLQSGDFRRHSNAIKPYLKDENIRSYLIEKIIPAITEKWPREDSNNPIFIQQDNARTHYLGFDIRLVYQPPNSPDFNVLDLGFFRAIQSLQHKENPTTIDELVAAVNKSYDEFFDSSIASSTSLESAVICSLD